MQVNQLQKELASILEEMIKNEEKFNELVAKVHDSNKLSAKNLLRYLQLRSMDLRGYHGKLSDLGISSLRSAEGYVYSNLRKVVKNLYFLQKKSFEWNSEIEEIGYTRSMELIRSNANALFNEAKDNHFTDIMVTFPTEASKDIKMIRKMAEAGMGVARINLSHDTKADWEQMIENIKKVEKETGKDIQIYMDLSGPKIRTTDIQYKNEKGKIKSKLPLAKGDEIILVKESDLDKDLVLEKNSEKLIIGVSLDRVIDDAKVNDRILFDDGMIESKVIQKKDGKLQVSIVNSYKSKLGSQKGINLPDTKLDLPSLTEKDLEALPFACKHADIIGYSFVRSAEDVASLYEELQKNNASNTGVVFKIENREAFENLPEILLKGMERKKIGVMIARGDLAVEIGFERISEVQDQILWFCEAAHIPVIWATQVLENLAKTGIPTRAEVSDAAKAAQAECVMLNKGPHILEAIKTLKNILRRMEEHSFKKKDELRALKVADRFMEKRIKN